MSRFIKGMACSACGKRSALEPTQVCPECFGPLEVEYDYGAIADALRTCKVGCAHQRPSPIPREGGARSAFHEALAARPAALWRFRELLPLAGEPTVGQAVGFAPLVKADRLAKALGVAELHVKDETVSQPSGSFKDRLVAVALSKANEFGLKTVACSTTGNLGLALSALAAPAGFRCVVFVPDSVTEATVAPIAEHGANVVRVGGDYDRVNRLTVEVADRYGWAFVNVNLKPYYAEGSKTIGFELVQQLGWRAPGHIVAPMGSGSLLVKMGQALRECVQVGLLAEASTCLHGAQASGCAPIVAAVKTRTDIVQPVKPAVRRAHSIAIGNPADGAPAARAILDSGGWADEANEGEIADAMRLLAETEGIHAEHAGGVTVAVTQKLIRQGRIGREAAVVICVTGAERPVRPSAADQPMPAIPPSLREFDKLCRERGWRY